MYRTAFFKIFINFKKNVRVLKFDPKLISKFHFLIGHNTMNIPCIHINPIN